MKTASILLCAAAIVFASASCDKHSFEGKGGTRVLHEGMHKDGHGDKHAEPAHAKEADHGAKAEEHGTKKADH